MELMARGPVSPQTRANLPHCPQHPEASASLHGRPTPCLCSCGLAFHGRFMQTRQAAYHTVRFNFHVLTKV